MELCPAAVDLYLMTIEKMNENHFGCIRDVSCQGFGLLLIQRFGRRLYASKKSFLVQASRGDRMNSKQETGVCRQVAHAPDTGE